VVKLKWIEKNVFYVVIVLKYALIFL